MIGGFVRRQAGGVRLSAAVEGRGRFCEFCCRRTMLDTHGRTAGLVFLSSGFEPASRGSCTFFCVLFGVIG